MQLLRAKQGHYNHAQTKNATRYRNHNRVKGTVDRVGNVRTVEVTVEGVVADLTVECESAEVVHSGVLLHESLMYVLVVVMVNVKSLNV
eukprot:6466174-Amphidinium_carterae.1